MVVEGRKREGCHGHITIAHQWLVGSKIRFHHLPNPLHITNCQQEGMHLYVHYVDSFICTIWVDINVENICMLHVYEMWKIKCTTKKISIANMVRWEHNQIYCKKIGQTNKEDAFWMQYTYTQDCPRFCWHAVSSPHWVPFGLILQSPPMSS